MNAIRLNIVEQGRGIEWATSAVLIMFSLILMLPGNTLASPAFKAFVSLGLTEITIAVPLMLVGVARMVALYLNGHWRRSPILRMVGAILGASIFGMLTVAFAAPTVELLIAGRYVTPVSGPSTGAGTYFVLVACDLLAVFRSGADVRVSRKITIQP